MRNRSKHPLSSEDMSDTSYDPGLYPLASLSLVFPLHSLLAPLHPYLPPRLPPAAGQLANGDLPRADDVVPPRGTIPGPDWTGHVSSVEKIEWPGRASTIPRSVTGDEIVRFRPNRMVDYRGASTTATAGEGGMKWGGNGGDAQSGRSIRSMVNDVLTRHSRITPLGACGKCACSEGQQAVEGFGVGITVPGVTRLMYNNHSGKLMPRILLQRALLALSVSEMVFYVICSH